MKFSSVFKTLGFLALGSHALVLPAKSAELDIEIKITNGADNKVSSAQSVAFPAKYSDIEQHVMEAVPMGADDQVHYILKQSQWDMFLRTPNRLVVLFIGAEWAGPSRAIRPKYAQLSNSYPMAVLLYADIDDAQIDVVKSARSVPLFLFYKNGSRVSEIVNPSPDQLEYTLRSNL